MSFQLADIDKLYKKDPNLKREDVQILAEWVKKQAHLPEIKELQLMLTLHSCYYSIEASKTTLDTYFTLKTDYSDYFDHLSEEILRRSLSVVFVNILPEKTPDGYYVMLVKLLDPKLDNFNIINVIKTIQMVNMFYLHQHGFDNGTLVVFDMNGYTLAHVTALNVGVLNKSFTLLQCMHPNKLYEKDPNLKREDIENLREWLHKQPHLPELEDMQLICFLHSCYYRLEPTKVTIDNYFTVKTHCSSDFLGILSEDVLKETLSVVFLNVLPRKTPENYVVMLLKLIDFRVENFNFLNIVRAINMICTLHLHQNGFDHGAVVIVDMEGATLGHITKVNIMTMKKALHHLQEGAPVRLKSIHFINVISFIDTVAALAKHLLKQEIYNMLQFHTNDSIDTLYKYVPQECLPKEYGGVAPSICTLNEICLKNLVNHFEFFAWHKAQIVDESKRIGRPKDANIIFGVEGSFKKLEID